VGRHIKRLLSSLVLAFAIAGLASSALAAGEPQVVVLPTTGIVDQTMAQYVAEGIDAAVRDGAAAVVIKLNTPGGALTSMNDIVGTILEAKVPVIVWVAPAGGFAASAGTFITMAANIALMAPGTRIGAASPIDSSGEDIPGTLGEKVRNDAIALATSIAQARHRNVAWAISAVSEAKSSPAADAVSLGVVDGMASSLDDVLAFANGRTVEVDGQEVTLDLDGATTTQIDMSPLQQFLRLLSDPNIALLLFSLGSAGLLAELYNPNFVTGILGGLALILAFIGLGTLPLNVGGLILIVFGMLLIGLELTVTSHGLLGFGGVLCIALGASALFTAPGNPFEPVVRVAPALIIGLTVTGALFVALIAFAAVRTRRMTGSTGLFGTAVTSGAQGVVRSPISPIGSAYIAGEEWTARSADDQPIERGTPIKVVAVDGLTVLVEPDPQPSQA
jgi:membrane-bound serine protease (ClpP class)